MVPLPYSCDRSNRYSIRLQDFSLTIPGCYKDVYLNSFFLLTLRPRNSLPAECFPLSYDLNDLKDTLKTYIYNVILCFRLRF